MTTELAEYAKEKGVDIWKLLAKIADGLAGVSISPFTDAELEVLQTAVELHL